MNLAQLIMHVLHEHGVDFRHFPQVDENGKSYNFIKIHKEYHTYKDNWDHSHDKTGAITNV